MMYSSQRIPEETLIPVIKNSFLDKLQTEGLLEEAPSDFSVDVEFKSYYGIPDVIFYSLNKDSISQRNAYSADPELSNDVVRTLMLLTDKEKISLSFLESHLSVGKNTIKNNILKCLTENNYLTRSNKDDDIYWVERPYLATLSSLYSVEAKVSNWKRGFYQAYRYRWFSHYSFLALAEEHLKPALKNIELFKEYNVGLLSVSGTNQSLELIYKPVREYPLSEEMANFTSEKILKNYLDKNASSHIK